MKTIKFLSFLASSFLASSALAATNWTVSVFLDGSNAATLQAENATAWSTTGGGGALASGCIHDYGTWGSGVVNAAEATPCTNEPGAGPHAADNVGQTDMFLLEFLAPVTLTQINIGWNGNDNNRADSDLSVLAYTGSGSGSSALAGKTLSGLTTSGWTVVGNYSDVGLSNGLGSGVSAGGSATVSTTTVSSWWLVSAYSSVFGAIGPNIGSPFGDGNDYFKLLSVAGNTQPPGNQTPEPGSLALLGAGLFGMMAMRRRRQTEA